MDYSMILSKFRTCLEDIGDALRKISGTNQKYKFSEMAKVINNLTIKWTKVTITASNIKSSTVKDITSYGFTEVYIESAITPAAAGGDGNGCCCSGVSVTPTRVIFHISKLGSGGAATVSPSCVICGR